EGGVGDAGGVGPGGDRSREAQLGRDPVGPRAGGDRARLERRRRPLQWLELLPEAFEAGLIEAGADLRDVDEPTLVIEADVKGAEVATRALGIRVATHHEFLPTLALDLDPLARATARVHARRT